QRTRPPPGRTDEDPTVLANDSILFVRTKQSARKVNGEWVTTTRRLLELLAHGKLQRIASLSFSASDSSATWLNYYGHYNWPERIAAAPWAGPRRTTAPRLGPGPQPTSSLSSP